MFDVPILDLRIVVSSPGQHPYTQEQNANTSRHERSRQKHEPVLQFSGWLVLRYTRSCIMMVEAHTHFNHHKDAPPLHLQRDA